VADCPASILCGYFEFDRDSLHPLVAALPPFIHLRGTDSSEFAWLQDRAQFHDSRDQGG
jgi:Cupin